MSIKRYLFILIGGIVLAIAAIQILLVAFFKQHLNQEIVEKSQRLSTQIIDFAVEQVDSNEDELILLTPRKSSSEDTSASPRLSEFHHSEPIESNCTVTESTEKLDEASEDGQTISSMVKLTCKDSVNAFKYRIDAGTESAPMPKRRVLTEEQLEEEKLRWKQRLHKIIQQKHEGQNVVKQFSFVTNGPVTHNQTVNHRVFDERIPQSNAIETLVDYMVYLIIASSVVALLLAFWLSNHFTKPLQKLSKGFQKLESGEFGVQVDVSGINEYRKTIGSFNQMSLRLAKLAENEKLLQQQGHLAELGEVSRGLAHALRNPMHTIGLSVEQLKDTTLPDNLRTKLQDKIQNKIKHIDKTIKALLTLTSAEIQRNEEVPIRSVIQDIILEMKASDPNIKIEFDYPEGPTSIKGAESEIRAIIHTLIVNAVEANSKEGSVKVQLIDKQNHTQIKVIDQGQGIAPSIADRLFQPHVSSKTEGAGMGLYISRRLATLYYDGEITLNDNQTGGCCATVTLSKG